MYDIKLESMTLTELHTESERLQKMLVDGRHSESVSKQILEFLNTVDQRISEVTFMDIFEKSQKGKSSVIEIGYTEEVVYTPDYSKQELLDALVFEYTTGDNNDTKLQHTQQSDTTEHNCRMKPQNDTTEQNLPTESTLQHNTTERNHGTRLQNTTVELGGPKCTFIVLNAF